MNYAIKALLSLVVVGTTLQLTAGTAAAELKMSALFTDNMVLQRSKPVPVWGESAPDETITVTFAGQKKTARADASGHWQLDLAAMAASSEPREMDVVGSKAGDSRKIKNVLVGEVWLASGQSNMQFPLALWDQWPTRFTEWSKSVIAHANDPQLRFFTVPHETAVKPQSNVTGLDGNWQLATPTNAGQFSAVAYFFAKELREKLGVPVGIIHSSWGGTPAESWTSREALEANPKLKVLVETRDRAIATYPAVKKDWDQGHAAWQAKVEKARSESRPEPHPLSTLWAPNNEMWASNIYNKMIAPMIPYRIRGVIWYQGETNVGRDRQYRTLFPTMIKDWRQRWNEGNFPFLFVQLANYGNPQLKPVEGEWAGLREAQAMALSLPNTGMAVAIDLADPEDPQNIHPHDKKPFGHRLALIALNNVYGKDVPYSGPLFEKETIEGNQIRITYTHTAGGLKAEGGVLRGFAVAGPDGQYVWANARIDGDTVVVSSPKIAQPTDVRYDWADDPDGNLYNGVNLPAAPFRTDPYRDQ